MLFLNPAIRSSDSNNAERKNSSPPKSIGKIALKVPSGIDDGFSEWNSDGGVDENVDGNSVSVIDGTSENNCEGVPVEKVGLTE